MPVVSSSATHAMDLAYVSLIFLNFMVAITYTNPNSCSTQQEYGGRLKYWEFCNKIRMWVVTSRTAVNYSKLNVVNSCREFSGLSHLFKYKFNMTKFPSHVIWSSLCITYKAPSLCMVLYEVSSIKKFYLELMNAVT